MIFQHSEDGRRTGKLIKIGQVLMAAIRSKTKKKNWQKPVKKRPKVIENYLSTSKADQKIRFEMKQNVQFAFHYLFIIFIIFQSFKALSTERFPAKKSDYKNSNQDNTIHKAINHNFYL